SMGQEPARAWFVVTQSDPWGAVRVRWLRLSLLRRPSFDPHSRDGNVLARSRASVQPLHSARVPAGRPDHVSRAAPAAHRRGLRRGCDRPFHFSAVSSLEGPGPLFQGGFLAGSIGPAGPLVGRTAATASLRCRTAPLATTRSSRASLVGRARHLRRDWNDWPLLRLLYRLPSRRHRCVGSP